MWRRGTGAGGAEGDAGSRYSRFGFCWLKLEGFVRGNRPEAAPQPTPGCALPRSWRYCAEDPRSREGRRCWNPSTRRLRKLLGAGAEQERDPEQSWPRSPVPPSQLCSKHNQNKESGLEITRLDWRGLRAGHTNRGRLPSGGHWAPCLWRCCTRVSSPGDPARTRGAVAAPQRRRRGTLTLRG